MSSDNPTVAAAQKDTGIAPLNSGPTEPQPPQHDPVISDPTVDQVPSGLKDLPSPYEGFVLPLNDPKTNSNKKNNQAISADFPSDKEFEDLVNGALYPEGPVRAEEVEKMDDLKWPPGQEEVMSLVALQGSEKGTGKLKLFKVARGQGKADCFAVKVDLDAERVVGIRFAEQ